MTLDTMNAVGKKWKAFLKSVDQTVDQASLKTKEGLTDESANPSYY